MSALRIGPLDHGRAMSYEEFLAGDYEEGYKYELIRGELYVSPWPDPSHDAIAEYVYELLTVYKVQHRQVIKRLSSHARVFLTCEPKTTCPEPDLALYNDYRPSRYQQDWEAFSPFIVIEIVNDSDPDKDYVRNVALYQRVPTILEYWVFDNLNEDEGPTLRVYRRDSGDQAWTHADYGPTAIYATVLLPGFTLPVSLETA